MNPSGRRQSARPQAAAGAAVRDPMDGEQHSCTCCEPRNPLVMRPDLGVLGDGSAEYALCVLHEPEPTVYRNRGDGSYVAVPSLRLTPSGEIANEQGEIVARVAGDDYQRLSTVDDDDLPRGDDPGGGPEGMPGDHRPSQPRTVHVDLSQDDFYSRP